MRRSKLEMSMDILSVIASKGRPLRITHIMCKSNMNSKLLKEQLTFLMQNGLVEERIITKKRVIYGITLRGLTIIKAFKEIKQAFPIEEEEQRQAPALF